MNIAVQKVAKFTRDLLEYDPQLIKIGRSNAEWSDFEKPIITVDATSIAKCLGRTEYFDGEKEKFYYSSLWETPITLSFFGDSAYSTAMLFVNTVQSGLSRELQNKHDITVFSVSTLFDVKALTGEQYQNRIDINFKTNHTEITPIDTRRIDEALIQFIQR